MLRVFVNTSALLAVTVPSDDRSADDVHWVTHDQHHTALTALLVANCRELSLVDCVSFTVMREAGIDTAFAFGRHFGEQGFRVLPG